jgi:hypothetical protein
MLMVKLSGKIAAIAVILFCLSASASTITIGANKEVLIDGKPFFPIMVWLQNAWRIAGESSYGINTFVGQGDNSSALAYCDSAKAHSVYAVPSWAGSAAGGAVKSHSAMLGWVFGDEPDLQGNKVPPSAIHAQYDSIKSMDPGHLAFLTTTSGFYSGDAIPAWMNGSDSMYYQYPLYADLIGFDYYPVYGWCRPDWIYKVGGSQDELVNKYTKGTKATYQWIECVKTSSQWCQLAARGVDDGPTAYEVKDEVWLAIANGANAIGYFTHSWECPGTTYSQMCLNDSLVTMLTQINREITSLTNVLCAADSKTAITVALDDPKGKVVLKAKDYNGAMYLIAVSVLGLPGANETQKAVFTVPNLTSTIYDYGEDTSYTPTGGAFPATFTKTSPVHIYEIPGAGNSVRPDLNRPLKLRGVIRNGPENGVLFNIAGKKVPVSALKPGQVYFSQSNGIFKKYAYVK